MKNLFAIFLAALSIASTSCSSDDEKDLESKLIGTWYYKNSSVAPNDGFILNTDHSGATFYKDYSWYFHWTLNGDVLTVQHSSEHESLNKSERVIFVSENSIMWGTTIYTSNPNDCYTGSSGSSTSGYAPSSLTSKTLNLYKSDKSYWMGIAHKSAGSCMVDLYNDAMVSSSYPPTYSYSPNGSKANYTLTFTTQTYIPFYGSYTYSQFKENITLQFSSSSQGSYSGTQTNMNGGSKQISGSFIIK